MVELAETKKLIFHAPATQGTVDRLAKMKVGDLYRDYLVIFISNFFLNKNETRSAFKF